MSNINNDAKVDSRSVVSVLTAFSLSLFLISVLIRTYVKGRTNRLGLDDGFYFCAVAFAVIQASIVFLEIDRGLGKLNVSLSKDQRTVILQAIYVSDLFHIIALCSSKLSIACLYYRLTPARGHIRVIRWTASSCVAWMLCSMLLIAFRCNTKEPWLNFSHEQCSNLFTKQEVVTALDIITELSLFAISIYIVWGLRITMNAKIMVVVAFGFRLPTIALSALRLHFLRDVLHQTTIDNYFNNIIPSISSSQLNIGYSILASIVPCLKNFMSAFEQPNTSSYSHLMQPSGTSKNKKHFVHKSSIFVRTGASEMSWEWKGNTERSRPDSPTYPEAAVTRKGMGNMSNTVCEATITRRPTLQHGIGGERPSADDDSDRRMIILQGLEWSVAFARDSRATLYPSPAEPVTISARRMEEGRGVL